MGGGGGSWECGVHGCWRMCGEGGDDEEWQGSGGHRDSTGLATKDTRESKGGGRRLTFFTRMVLVQHRLGAL